MVKHLQQLRKPRRKLVKAGEIFAFSFDGLAFYYGLVVDNNFALGPFEECLLLYIFRQKSSAKDSIPLDLRADQLLIPPIVSDHRLFQKRVFETVGRVDDLSAFVLYQHCFIKLNGKYVDEDGNEINDPQLPCLEYSLYTDAGVEWEIAKGLGLI